MTPLVFVAESDRAALALTEAAQGDAEQTEATGFATEEDLARFAKECVKFLRARKAAAAFRAAAPPASGCGATFMRAEPRCSHASSGSAAVDSRRSSPSTPANWTTRARSLFPATSRLTTSSTCESSRLMVVWRGPARCSAAERGWLAGQADLRRPSSGPDT